MADAKDPDALHCDIVVSQVTGGTDENGFQADIRFFDSSGEIHATKATAGNPLVALDIAHDEIERKYFQEQRVKHEKQKIKDTTRRRADLKKRALEEDAPRRREEEAKDEE